MTLIDKAEAQSAVRAYLVNESTEIALHVEQIIAALPARGEGVRCLVWEDFDGLGAKASAFYQANYLIQWWKGEGRYEVALSYPGYQTGYDGVRWHDTLEAAKAAAQADYEARILAALAAAVPDDLADAGKVADAADIYQFWVGDNLVNLGQTIRSLLASIAAQEAQIERLEIVAQEAKAGWRDAESFSTEQKTDALKWFDLAHQNKLRAEAAETALAAEREKVARLVEAGPPFFFDRYINGVRMAEDVCVERETTLEGAMRVAARIAAKGPNGEPPVLVYRSTETAALAAITEAGQ